MDYNSLLYKPYLISFLKSTSAKDKQYKSITDEIVFSLENTVPIKYNAVYEEFYRKYKFKLLNVPSATTGLQFALYEYDFGKSINKIVGKVSNERVVLLNTTLPSFLPVITSFDPIQGVAVSQACLDPGPQLVYIYGENLYPASSVTFNGVEALVGTYAVAYDGTEIQVFVPQGATTGKITVTTPKGTVTSTTNFTVTSGTCND
jgi:hypothetical protein